MERKRDAEPSRRLFLAGGLALAATAHTPQVRAQHREGPERMRFASILPEYAREMRELVIAIHVDPNHGLAQNDASMFETILPALPTDTRITAVVTRGHEAELRQWLEELLGRNQDRLTVIDSPSVEPWAQDAFEPISLRGTRQALVPRLSGARTGSTNETRYASHVATARAVFKEHVTEAPFYFEGGDLVALRDRDGRPMILMGHTSAQPNIAELKTMHPSADLDALFGMLKERVARLFPDSILHVVPPLSDRMTPDEYLARHHASEHLFHLDQMSLPLRDGEIALAEVAVTEDDRYRYGPKIAAQMSTHAAALERAAQHLKGLGFEVYRITHTMSDIRSHAYAMNASLFARDGVHHAFVPLYDNHLDLRESNRDKEPITLVEAGTATHSMLKLLQSRGVRTIGVRDGGAYAMKGSVHCRLNVVR